MSEQSERMPEELGSPLLGVEARLRDITPAILYADSWINPNVRNLTKLFNHLRTMYRILYGYLPRQVISDMPQPGINRHQWEEGTLMFTDLTGFTPLLEGNSKHGKEGAQSLLEILNGYFSEMLVIVSKSGGNLLEFTGDALLVQFPTDRQGRDTSRAVRAGLRMQRAMAKYAKIETEFGDYSLGMRIGLHVGRFLIADIGTPHRMEHVLLGNCVLRTKLAEGNGKPGYVCLTDEAKERVMDEFHFLSKHKKGYSLVKDDLSEEELGDYDILPPRTRMASMVLFDTSREGLITAITDSVEKVEPLASFIPRPLLHMLVENAAARGLPPDFPDASVLFVNLLGVPDNLSDFTEAERDEIVSEFSRVVSLVNAEIESAGGVMKKVTYHHAGPDIMAFFGVPDAHTNDTLRAVTAAYQIKDIISRLKPLKLGSTDIQLEAHIGLTQGRVFSAEIGESQGRREYNIMGNTVNTAARLMDHAQANEILVSEEVYDDLVAENFEAEKLEAVTLKGRSVPLDLYLIGRKKR
ncbi:MAG: adenylate/guanylate cyclase domain-containing protein [Anaerolineae bacterium]|nr:adenylate/guanylate cyclase domain-containing protein [Anaerolineae bacterium]